MQFMSPALGRHVTYTALLPDPTLGPGPFPVLYQLHGASDDHQGWIQYANLARYVSRLGLITILPDGGMSFWLNRSPRERYEDFVMDDLANHVGQTFHVKPGKAAIGGLSMGGFGAVYLGLKHPDRFASIWAHSGAFRTYERLLELGWGEDAARTADVAALVASVEGDALGTLSFDCGTEDSLLPGNRLLDRLLTERKLPHRYLEHPGGHTWDYWDTHVQEALQQHVKVLGVSQIPS